MKKSVKFGNASDRETNQFIEQSRSISDKFFIANYKDFNNFMNLGLNNDFWKYCQHFQYFPPYNTKKVKFIYSRDLEDNSLFKLARREALNVTHQESIPKSSFHYHDEKKEARFLQYLAKIGGPDIFLEYLNYKIYWSFFER